MSLADFKQSIKLENVLGAAPEAVVADLPQEELPPDVLIEQDDGSMVVDLPAEKKKDDKFDSNLAEYVDESTLSSLAQDLLDGINADIESRREWEETFNRGVDLLGLKIENGSNDVTSGGSVSKVYHPILLEAVIRYQSNFRGEMLPSAGPVKVRDDHVQNVLPDPEPPPMGLPMPPPEMAGGMAQQQQPMQGMAGAMPPPKPPTINRSVLAEALEKDMNHYLTAVDKPYYPDTDRMSFSQALVGCAFKKVYRCPILRRPISRFVMATDLIVSNDASSLEDATRVTHRSKMSQATMIRMKLSGAYRDVDLSHPIGEDSNTERHIKEKEGIAANNIRQEDNEFTIYETYVNLDLAGFEHKNGGKMTGLPLPYRVTIDRDSQTILEIRRNWKKDDEDFLPRRRFVKYSYIPGLGFYDYGLVHILGNTSRALTAILRQLIDAGQFANFPGGLISKNGSRQETNNFRMAPGGFKTIDTGGLPISQIVMPLPYKEPSATLMQLGASVAEDARRLGGTAELNVGEGRADAPVGTTIAMIEQATKVEGAVHKRNHTAQQEEFELLKELFTENPEALWKFAKSPQRKWEQAQEFDDLSLVPCSDANTPSHVHRLMKAQALVQLAQAAPMLFDQYEVANRVLRIMGEQDIDDILKRPPPPGVEPPNPMIELKQQELAMKKIQAEARMRNDEYDHQDRMAELNAEVQQREADRQAKMKIELMQTQQQAMKDAKNYVPGVVARPEQ